MERWWNVLSGETTFWEENRFKCHFVHHKSDMNRAGIEHGGAVLAGGGITAGLPTVMPFLFIGADLTENILKLTSYPANMYGSHSC